MLSDGFLERLRYAYFDWIRDFEGPGIESMWSSLDAQRRDVHEALLRGGPELRELLLNPQRTYLYYGVENIFNRPAAAEGERLALVERTRSTLVDLLRALGIWRMHNPEGGTLCKAGERLPDPPLANMLEALRAYSGVPLDFRDPFPGDDRLDTPHGVITVRTLNALYQALALQRLRRTPVLEIGAGMGKTAYYAHRLGVADYTIVDLPLSLVGQAVFLALTLGEKDVGLDRLLSPAQFHASPRPFKLVLNADSMPEMHRAFAEQYVERMRRDGAYFVSINHEANAIRVSEIAPLEARRFRAPYLLRPGYVEEHFEF